MLFLYTDEHHTPYTYEYIDHTLEETDERVLDYPIEVPETSNPYWFNYQITIY